ncbi:hypothetical protein K431DRAFT_283235 [Polychaeton citri CBS 116435]|uniref:Uncharacterized protein n=1 Tax=Polychaeton citri CBS 116435 TaxID=1314669 RepID=A0A9P4QAY9_9PEZI|nr:hypothetical protein K431DRAFT_283235 [Polychaeton citri CBS 116435]
MKSKGLACAFCEKILVTASDMLLPTMNVDSPPLWSQGTPAFMASGIHKSGQGHHSTVRRVFACLRSLDAGLHTVETNRAHMRTYTARKWQCKSTQFQSNSTTEHPTGQSQAIQPSIQCAQSQFPRRLSFCPERLVLLSLSWFLPFLLFQGLCRVAAALRSLRGFLSSMLAALQHRRLPRQLPGTSGCYVTLHMHSQGG